MKEVVIVSGSRTAIGTFGGSLQSVPVVELGALVIKDALKRAGLRPVAGRQMEADAPDKLKGRGLIELEKQSRLERPDPDFIQKLRSYSIREFEKAHDRLETSLEHLSTLIIKYLPPFDDQQLCHQVLNDLAALVKDLKDHADMEDKVLVPRVAELEEALLNSPGLI